MSGPFKGCAGARGCGKHGSADDPTRCAFVPLQDRRWLQFSNAILLQNCSIRTFSEQSCNLDQFCENHSPQVHVKWWTCVDQRGHVISASAPSQSSLQQQMMQGRGEPVAAVATSSPAASRRSACYGGVGRTARRGLGDGELDVHRMNAAQARIALLQRLSALVAALPRGDVEATKQRMELGAYIAVLLVWNVRVLKRCCTAAFVRHIPRTCWSL